MTRAMRRLEAVIVLAIIAAGMGLTWLLLTRSEVVSEAWTLLSAWSFILVGLLVRVWRPGNRTGLLMVLVGLVFMTSRLSESDQVTLRTIGAWVQTMHLAILTHILLALPTGRLGSRSARMIVLGIYLDFGTLAHAPIILGAGGAGAALRWASYVIGALLLGAAGVHLLGRWRTGSTAWRRSVAPALWVGAFTILALFAWGVNAALGGVLGVIPSWTLRLAFVALPFSFLAVVLRSQLARGLVAGLVVELERSQTSEALRDALSRTLRDPSLQVAYWLPDERRYVDIDGHPVALPDAGDPQTATLVEREGRQVAAIIHDATLDDDPELVRAAGAAAALALDNERLHAELRAQLDELSASRTRMLRAADEERKRIERNLHDGTQQRLTSIAISLGLAEAELRSDPNSAATTLSQAKVALGSALAELREFSQGIHPSSLTSRGLGAAIRDLAYTAPLPVRVACPLQDRLPEPVEAAAYYVVAEGLANIAKHAGASSAEVRLAREPGRLVVTVEDDGRGGAEPAGGTGLRGLADRVRALGGSLEVESADGRGTVLRASIPCA